MISNTNGPILGFASLGAPAAVSDPVLNSPIQRGPIGTSLTTGNNFEVNSSHVSKASASYSNSPEVSQVHFDATKLSHSFDAFRSPPSRAVCQRESGGLTANKRRSSIFKCMTF